MPQRRRHCWQATVNSSHAKGRQCDGCTTIKTTIKKQASNGHGQKAQDRRQATIFFTVSQMAVMPQGRQHCRQANLMYSKLQWSRPASERICVSGGSIGRTLELAVDLSCGNRVSETAEYCEKVPCTSVRPHLDLVPGGNGTGMRLTRADT
jgi:hypothetical protein